MQRTHYERVSVQMERLDAMNQCESFCLGRSRSRSNRSDGGRTWETQIKQGCPQTGDIRDAPAPSIRWYFH
jgi:hypothetical protein